MEMFNVHRRDIMNFDNYMDLKKPGFGGPNSAKAFRDNSGKKVNRDPRLAEYQRVVNRDPAFSHPVYDPTYKAMTHDLVYKQEKKKPFTYADPYHTGIPVINVAEGKCAPSFDSFINEGWFSDDSYDHEESEKLRREMEEEEARHQDWKREEREKSWNDYNPLADSDDEFSDWDEYGANPMMGGNETRIACRNEDKAEDILLDMKIDWDGWDEAPVGNGKSFTKDGDIVAYFDDSVRPHQLVILPEAETMSDEEYNRVMATDSEMPEEEEEEEESNLLSGDEDDEVEEYENEEEEEEEDEEKIMSPKKSNDIKDIERLLKSFETEEDEEDEY